jgi:glycosyltransferase involved in cell wall biosynthesis
MNNILVFTTTFPTFLERDSTPPFVYELSRRLAKKEDVHVIVLAPFRKKTKIFEERDNLKIYRFKYGFTSLCEGAILPNLKKNKFLYFQVPFLLFFAFVNLARIVKKEKINIIHAHWIIPQGFIAVLYKKLFRKKNLKIICTSHGGDIFGLQNPFMKKIKRWILNNVDRLTVVSNAIKEEVKKLNMRDDLPTEVISMGVDAKLFNPDKYNPEIKEKYDIEGSFLLFVGRLAEKKGVKYLIDAMPAIIQEHPKTKLLIVGSGPLENELKKQIKNLNLENNVIFTGAIPNNELPSYYATADIFIGPSIIAKGGDAEGFGLVFVEALMSKTCVISSDLKAISDIIKNEETGIQLNVKDVKGFSEKIVELIENLEKRKKLTENGYNFVKNNFSWDVIADKYYKILKLT